MNRLNNFEEYGFTADFEGEILKTVSDYYVGWLTGNDGICSALWNKSTGLAIMGYRGSFYCGNSSYNLKPIKKEWYEDENNIGKALYDTVEDKVVLLTWLDEKGNVMKNNDNTIYRHERFRRATKVEALSLYIK